MQGKGQGSTPWGSPCTQSVAHLVWPPSLPPWALQERVVSVAPPAPKEHGEEFFTKVGAGEADGVWGSNP